MMADWQQPALILMAGALGTFLCRGLGVFFAGRIDPNGEFFQWVSCVTYAMIAGLTVRLIVFPQGLLETMPLGLRLTISLAGMVYVWMRPFNSLLPALFAGVMVTLAYGAIWGG
jgi:hypothetical protein